MPSRPLTSTLLHRVSVLSACLLLLHSCNPIQPVANEPLPAAPHSHPPAYNPDFFFGSELDPAILAVTANHYIALGETRAVAEMLAASKRAGQADLSWNSGKRIAIICRILFRQPGEPISPPGFGMIINLPEQSMSRHDWPDLPLVQSRGVYFLLGQGYVLSGIAETAPDYICRCRRAGVFRTRPIKVPTRSEALAAVDALTREPRWQQLPPSNAQSAESTLRRQADAISLPHRPAHSITHAISERPGAPKSSSPANR